MKLVHPCIFTCNSTNSKVSNATLCRKIIIVTVFTTFRLVKTAVTYTHSPPLLITQTNYRPFRPIYCHLPCLSMPFGEEEEHNKYNTAQCIDLQDKRRSSGEGIPKWVAAAAAHYGLKCNSSSPGWRPSSSSSDYCNITQKKSATDSHYWFEEQPPSATHCSIVVLYPYCCDGVNWGAIAAFFN